MNMLADEKEETNINVQPLYFETQTTNVLMYRRFAAEMEYTKRVTSKTELMSKSNLFTVLEGCLLLKHSINYMEI